MSAQSKLVIVLLLGAFAALFISPEFWTRENDEPHSAGREILTVTTLFERSEAHDFEAPKPGTYRLPVIKPAADGDVLDMNGEAKRLKALMRGRVVVLSFIYTLCSDEKGCPLAVSTLFDSYDASLKMPVVARNARFITLSFDPVNDTPEVMRSFGYPVEADPDRDRKMDWKFLTSRSSSQLAPILKAYGQAIDIARNGEIMSHLLRLYLIDRKGRIRNIYGLGMLDPRLLYTDILTLLMEDGTIGTPAS